MVFVSDFVDKVRLEMLPGIGRIEVERGASHARRYDAGVIGDILQERLRLRSFIHTMADELKMYDLTRRRERLVETAGGVGKHRRALGAVPVQLQPGAGNQG